MPEPTQDRPGRWALLATFAVITCCAGPVVLAALGLGSVGALLGGVTGSFLLVVAGGLLVVVAVVIFLLRRREGSPRGRWRRS